MSLADDLMAEVGAPLLFEFGADATSVTYYPQGAASVSLRAVVGAVQTRDEAGPYGRQQPGTRSVHVLRDADDATYGGIANPSLADEIEIDSARWAVTRIIAQTETLTQLEVIRKQAIEVSRPGYRRTL